MRVRPTRVNTHIRQGAGHAAWASSTRDQLAQLDRVKLTVNIGLGIRKEAISSPTIGILSVNEQRDSQWSGHEEAPREAKK